MAGGSGFQMQSQSWRSNYMLSLWRNMFIDLPSGSLSLVIPSDWYVMAHSQHTSNNHCKSYKVVNMPGYSAEAVPFRQNSWNTCYYLHWCYVISSAMWIELPIDISTVGLLLLRFKISSYTSGRWTFYLGR